MCEQSQSKTITLVKISHDFVSKANLRKKPEIESPLIHFIFVVRSCFYTFVQPISTIANELPRLWSVQCSTKLEQNEYKLYFIVGDKRR